MSVAASCARRVAAHRPRDLGRRRVARWRSAIGFCGRNATPPGRAIDAAGRSARAARRCVRSSVVLPPPLGPTSATTSPARPSSDTPSRTGVRAGPVATPLRRHATDPAARGSAIGYGHAARRTARPLGDVAHRRARPPSIARRRPPQRRRAARIDAPRRPPRCPCCASVENRRPPSAPRPRRRAARAVRRARAREAASRARPASARR